jgi:predicted nucleic acid-binding protein
LYAVIDYDRCLKDIDVLLVTTVEQAASVISTRQAFAVARAFRLTAYDAVYLETARREHLPLATLNGDLKKGATAAGVALVA